MVMPETKTENQTPTRIDAEGFEIKENMRTGDRSPDGAPANPEMNAADTQWLIAGSFGAVVLLAVAALAVFGFWVSLVVLVFGTVLAVVANPAIWAAAARSRERAPAQEP